MSEESGPVEMARRAKGTWHRHDQGYVDLETEAALVQDFQCNLVPGLLRTEAYTRCLFEGSHADRSPGWIDDQVAMRSRRQERLRDPTRPLRLDAVTTHTALHQPVGGKAVLRQQLGRLLELSELPTVEFRLLPPTIGAHDGLNGSFTLLRFADPGGADVVYAEHALGAIHSAKEMEVRECTVRFAHLRSTALSHVESVAVVRQVMDAM